MLANWSFFLNRIFIAILFLSFFEVSIFAQNRKIYIAPKPGWLLPVKKSDKKPNPKDISNGFYFSLLEIQNHLEKKTSYIHQVENIISETGVQNGSEISISFNPSYEKLTLHEIIIRRNGSEINKLDISKFKLVQNESELSKYIYNETFTAFLILEDVQKGDVIDFSYSIEGNNPIFENKYYHDYYFHSYSPVVHLYRNIIFSPARKLIFKSFNNPPKPLISTNNGFSVYEWESILVKPHVSEDYEPSWSNDLPHIQISEAQNWGEITDWALRVNTISGNLSPELLLKINQLKQNAGGNRLRYIELAIHFVQDEIRYMGVEIGEHSHRPHQPNQIFKQRFGDCKDKSLLLATILNANGIESYPVLVNSYYTRETDKFLPSPLAFNHAIVYVKEGDEYWVDPTISLQKGMLGALYTPNYGKALIVKPGKNKLSDISEAVEGKIIVDESFFVSVSEKDTAILEVESNYYRSSAENMRSLFASNSIIEVEKSYLDYYSSTYKNSSVDFKDSLYHYDNEKDNIFSTKEKYKISNFWKIDSSTNVITCSFFAQMIYDQLRLLPDKLRKNPISINYPYDLDYTIKIHLPEKWNAKYEEKTITRDAYKFFYRASLDDSERIVTIQFSYKTLKDFVPADKYKELRKDMNEIAALTEYGLTWNKGIEEEQQQNSKNWWLISYTLVLLLFLAFMGYKLYEYSLPVELYLNYSQNLGGWLILVAFGICLSPILILVSFFSIGFFDLKNWLGIEAMSTQRNLYKFIWMFEVTTNVFLFAYSIFIIVLFFKRRNTLPRFIIGFYSSNIILQIVDIMLSNQMSTLSSNHNLIRSIVGAAIWIPYFIYSNRVKETFVFPRHIEDSHYFWGDNSPNHENIVE